MKTVTLSANTSWYLFNFRGSTIRRFIDDGYHVVCLSPPDDYSRKLEDEFGAEWAPLPMDNMGSNPVKDLGLIIRFWRYYRELKPVAALHFTIKNNVYGTWAAALNGVPSVNNVSGLGTAFIRKGFLGVFVRLLYKLSMPLAFRVFCQNEEDYKLLIEKKLVPVDRLFKLPGSGVDLKRFHPGLVVPHHENFRFLFAGRLLADKGLYELIDAVGLINADGIRCTLWLCGFYDSENVSAIKKSQLTAWGDTPGVKYVGSSDSMEEVYANIDCVVLPSYREGMPRSLLEAGAMGLPVIATDVPGCRSIVIDGFNGILCAAKDTYSLMQAMQKMMNLTYTDRARMGEEGRRLVIKSFSEEIVVEQALAVVKSIENFASSKA